MHLTQRHYGVKYKYYHARYLVQRFRTKQISV